MKIVNGSEQVLMLPLGGQMMTILPKNVSSDIVASKSLVLAAITTNTPENIGLVTYSAAELQVINSVTGSSPYLYQNLEDAVSKLIPEGIQPIVETRVLDGGEAVIQSVVKVNDKTSDLEFEELSKLKSAYKFSTDKITELESQIEKITKENQDLSNKLKESELTSKNQSIDADLVKKSGDLEKTRAKLESLLQDEQGKSAELTSKLDEASKLIIEKNKKIEELSSYANLKEELDKLKDQNQNLISDLKESSDKITELSKSSVNPDELDKAKRDTDNYKAILAKTVETNKLVWNGAEGCYLPL